MVKGLEERHLVNELVERVGAEAPDRTAITQGGHRSTYGELIDLSIAFSHRLSSLGVVRGSRVGVLCDGSPHSVAALLAVMRLGAAYVPLNTRYSVGHMQEIIGVTGVNLVAAGTRPTTDPVSSVQVLAVDDCLNYESTKSSIAADSDDVAYICSTSGSSGSPKPVATTQRNCTSFMRAFSKALDLRSGDRFLARTPFSFDPHVVECLLPLTLGASLEVVPHDVANDPLEIGRIMAASGVTVAQGTPGFWQLMLEAGWRPTNSIKILCGGEPLPESLKTALLRLEGVRLWNVYGPTEGTVWCSALEMLIDRPVRIGGTLKSCRLEVIGQGSPFVTVPLPAGTVGELVITGDTVSPGYIGNPEATEARFIDGPTGERSYRTGDMASQTDDGEFEYLGRLDRQHKLRGHRIELADVEQRAVRHPMVSQVAVVVTDDDVLKACIVPTRARVGLTRDDDIRTCYLSLRAYFAQEVPYFLQPRDLCFADSLPMTLNEKVDEHAIRALEPYVVRLGEPLAIEDDLVGRVAAAVGRVLDQRPPLTNESFFDLGGDSVNLVQLQLELEGEFGRLIRASSIVANPTIRGIADRVREMLLNVEPSVRGDIEPTGVGRHPLSAGQIRLFLEAAPDELDGNYLQTLIRIDDWSHAEVQDAVRRLMHQHDVFRITRVVWDLDDSYQEASALPAAELDDLSDTCGSLDQFLEAIAAYAGKLSVVAGRFYSMVTFANDGSSYVYGIFNHLVCDDISLENFKRLLYRELGGTSAEKRSGAVSFLRWVDEVHRSESADRALRANHWADRLSSCSPFRAPTRSGPCRLHVEHTKVRLSAIGFGKVTPRETNGILLAAAAHHAARLFGLDTIGCRLVESGRWLDPGMDDGLTIGWMSHHHPLPLPVGERGVDTHASLMVELAASASNGRSYEWTRLACLDRRPQLSDLPLYFNYMPLMVSVGGLADVTALMPSRDQDLQAINGIAVLIREAASELDIRVYYNDDTCTATQMTDYTTDIVATAGDIIAAIRR